MSKKNNDLIRLAQESHDLRKLVRSQKKQIAKLESKSAQAYQVIGALAGVDDPEVIRALDYFSDTSAYNELFLPFTPPEDKP